LYTLPVPLEIIRVDSNRYVEDVVRVVRAVYDEYGFTWDEADYHADLYDLEGQYLSKDHPFFVASLGHEIVGTIALAPHDTVPGPHGEAVHHEDAIRIGGTDCSLERLYVHPHGRRQGVGRALMEQALNEARTRGRRLMEMWSDKRFQDAHRLYQRLGARVVGERICHDPDQSPEWGLIMEIV
jgi:putative acetyltransferase